MEDSLTYIVHIRLQPTSHPGQAVELARDAVRDAGDVLVVSVSGDGGYNEVVNGDHRLTTRSRPLEEAIAEGRV